MNLINTKILPSSKLKVVLSLFDGASMGQYALNDSGYKDFLYVASEVDKYPMSVAQYNYPNTVQIGDVRNIEVCEERGLHIPNMGWHEVDLLIGGSPCQDLSFSGKQKGLIEGERSNLFFEYLRILNTLKKHNPNLKFLLENVKMKKEYQDRISQEVGVQPIERNSADKSAQNRKRLYWFNWDEGELIKENVVLRDILECGCVDREKSHCLDANYFKGGNLKQYNEKSRRQLVFDFGSQGCCQGDSVSNQGRTLEKADIQKSHTLLQRDYKGFGNQAMTGVRQRCNNPDFEEDLAQMTTDEQKAYALTTSYTGATYWNSLERKQRTMIPICNQVGEADIKGHDKIRRVYGIDAKSPTLTANYGGNQEPKVACGAFRGRYQEDGSTKQNLEMRKDSKTNTITSVQKDNVVVNKDKKYWRKLTPIECERLQTLPDNYTSMGINEKGEEVKISNTQRYRMLGNGYTSKMISHFFNSMK